MADVFISYKSERRAAAEHLAEILSAHGYSVWWDYSLVSGVDFRAKIEAELHAAKAVIVLWCALSRSSRWVLDEATMAEKAHALIPVKIDGAPPAFGFGSVHTINLSEWDGAPQSDRLSRLLRDVAEKVGRPARSDAARLGEVERAWIRYGSPSLAKFALSASDASSPRHEQAVAPRRMPVRIFAGVLVAVVLAAGGLAAWRFGPLRSDPATPAPVQAQSVDEIVAASGVLGRWGLVRPETVTCEETKFIVVISFANGQLRQNLGATDLPPEDVDAAASSAGTVVTSCQPGVCSFTRTSEDQLFIRYGQEPPQELARCTQPAP